MAGNLDEKAVKEVLKKIIENNNNIPYKAKEENLEESTLKK